MKIKITRGIYGKKEGERIVEKNSGDPPFEIEEEEGERLIGLRVAVEMISRESESETRIYSDEDSEDDAVTDTGEKHISRDQLLEMGINGLRKLAGDMGLAKNGSKIELAERIATASVYTEDDEDMPDMIPAEPE